MLYIFCIVVIIIITIIIIKTTKCRYYIYIKVMFFFPLIFCMFCLSFDYLNQVKKKKEDKSMRRVSDIKINYVLE